MLCHVVPNTHWEVLTVKYCVQHYNVVNYVCMIGNYIKNVYVYKFHRSKYQ